MTTLEIIMTVSLCAFCFPELLLRLERKPKQLFAGFLITGNMAPIENLKQILGTQ